MFERVTPILRVRSLAASLDYYVNVLGFEVDWQQPEVIGSVSRDGCAIMLCEGDQGSSGTWVWIGVGDIEPLYEAYCARGARIRHPPTSYPWAYEMQIADPDGHVLRIGSEPKTDRPFGDRQDMHGETWVMSPAGTWTRGGRVDTAACVLDFVAAINGADLARMAVLMSEDHVFIDSNGTRIVGREAARECWRRYFSMIPDYRIAVEQTFARASTVVLVGTATGTYSRDGRLEPANRWSVPAAWRAEATEDRIAVWQVFVNPEPIAAVIRRCEGAV